MSERHLDRQKSHESNSSPEHERQMHEIQEAINEKASEAMRENAAEKLEKARHEAHKHAQETRSIEPESSPSQLNTFAGHQLLKKDAYKQILAQTQSKLSVSARAFSKFIHNPSIETISEVSSKTVARPSGLLGGGVGAFLGSLVLLYTSKYYGFEYNYTLFIVMFVGGFVAGLFIELVLKSIYKKS
jgi:hypothetical protein